MDVNNYKNLAALLMYHYVLMYVFPLLKTFLLIVRVPASKNIKFLL